MDASTAFPLIHSDLLPQKTHYLLPIEHGSHGFPQIFATPSQTIIRSIRVNPCSKNSAFKNPAIEDKAKQRFMIDLRQICFLNYLPRILHLLPQHHAKDHLYVFDERIMPIITIQPYFVGINNRVVILYRYVLRVAGAACFLINPLIAKFPTDALSFK